MTRSPSTLTSIAYNDRMNLGFKILLNLYENGLLERRKIPNNVLKMIGTWANMKKGRKHRFSDTLAGRLMSLLDDVPASNSERTCPDTVAKRIEAEGEPLLTDGYIVIFPIGLDNAWSYRRTILGDELLQVTGYTATL